MDYFVDFSAANNGDGTDGAQAGAPAGVGAFNQFTSGESALLNDGDVVWFRRTGTSNKKAVDIVYGTGPTPIEKIHYLGWPVDVTDKHYVQAQATANTVKVTWDADIDLFVFISPVAAAWAPEYLRIARMYAEELGAGANNFLTHNTGTPRDFTFYKCKCSRAAALPTIQASGNSRGVCEYDDVHVKGTTPSNVICGGHSTECSTLLRVRIELTDGGSSALDMTGTATQPRTGFYEILEWIDSGTHWVKTLFAFGTGQGSFVFTTDDDVVGQLDYEFHPSFNPANLSANVIIRNINLDHALAAVANQPLRTPSPGLNTHYENVTLHPTGHTTQVYVNGTYGKLTGRNIKNFDASKVDIVAVENNNEDAYRFFVHFSQINGTEAWYRLMNGTTAQISSVNRTGGAANAILVEPTNRPITLQQRGHHTGIFRSEFKGLEAFAFVKTGLSYPASETLTAYFAVANWDSIEDQDRIWFEVELYKNAGAVDFTRRVIDSRKLPPAQAFIADGSTWNGIFGYNAYRVEIPITIEKDDIVKVRFFVRDTHLSLGLQRNFVVFDPAAVIA